MKNFFVADIKKCKENEKVNLLGWIKSKRESKNVIFFDVADSTGNIQCVVKRSSTDTAKFLRLKKIPPETAVKISGNLITNKAKAIEIDVNNVQVIGEVLLNINPQPRKDFDIFNQKYADVVLKNRHLYLRNEKMMAVLKFKHRFLLETHKWFDNMGFIFIDAPILTKLLLYDDKSAFKVKYSENENIFLSQCNTFQLEAAVHAFEKVYNLTPSFRAEHSRTNRHLREYWHLKAEIAWANLDDLIKLAEKMLYNIIKNTAERSEKELNTLKISIDEDKIKPPYRIITYDEAVDILHAKGKKFEWGLSLGMDEEKILSHEMGENLFFVKGIPCSAEAFPFSRDSSNPKITRTCDLISPRGFGELLGTAEKICNVKELLERMTEKGKTTDDQMERYRWYVELRKFGCVPHGGIGMGVERVIRWILKLPHVRYAISFPRLYGRSPNP